MLIAAALAAALVVVLAIYLLGRHERSHTTEPYAPERSDREDSTADEPPPSYTPRNQDDAMFERIIHKLGE